MIVAKITKFIPICNSFMGAVTTASELPALITHSQGVPLYPKGSLVAYIDTPQKMFKGHLVKGKLKTISEVVLAAQVNDYTEEDIGNEIEEPEQEEDWGLR